jgi:hypothetical protein
MSTSEDAGAAGEAATAPDERSTTRAGEAAREDASSLYAVAARDAAIVVAVFSLFGGAEAWAQVSGLGFAVALSTLAGLLVGAVGTALVHEWGHFTAARLSGAVAPLVGVKQLVPLFVFDMERSTDEQFRTMSIGGNVAHAAAALLLLVALPDTSAGLVAVQAAAVGFAAFASTIELPVIRRAWEGEPRHEAFKAITRAVIQRAARVGLAVTGVLFLAL